MSSLTHPSRRDVDIFMETLEQEERMRQKQAELAYARYKEQRGTYHFTRRQLARFFLRLLLVAAFIGLLIWLDT